MGINTTGIIPFKYNGEDMLEEITEYIRNNYICVSVNKPTIDKFWIINFNYNEEKRSIHVYISNYNEYYEETGYSGNYIWMTLGCWGESVKYIKEIIQLFGGYMVDNDCDGEWYSVPKNNVNGVEISLQTKVMVAYGIDEKESSNWLEIYNKVSEMDASK